MRPRMSNAATGLVVCGAIGTLLLGVGASTVRADAPSHKAEAPDSEEVQTLGAFFDYMDKLHKGEIGLVPTGDLSLDDPYSYMLALHKARDRQALNADFHS